LHLAIQRGADPDSAHQKYLEQRDDLQAGRTPRLSGDGLTIRRLADRFLTAKQTLLRTSEIARCVQPLRPPCESHNLFLI
jgi:hypothetical protein